MLTELLRDFIVKSYISRILSLKDIYIYIYIYNKYIYILQYIQYNIQYVYYIIYIYIYIYYVYACCLWTSSADELFLERNVSATICSWTVRHDTALIVLNILHLWLLLRAKQRCWMLKTFNMSSFKNLNIHIEFSQFEFVLEPHFILDRQACFLKQICKKRLIFFNIRTNNHLHRIRRI